MCYCCLVNPTFLFPSLLQTLNVKFRQTPDLAEHEKPWTYRLVQLADMLLNHNQNVANVTPFTTQQRQAWDQMMRTLKELEARSSETRALAFQHLLLLVGLHLFKVSCCIEKGMDPGVLRHFGAPPHSVALGAVGHGG